MAEEGRQDQAAAGKARGRSFSALTLRHMPQVAERSGLNQRSLPAPRGATPSSLAKAGTLELHAMQAMLSGR